LPGTAAARENRRPPQPLLHLALLCRRVPILNSS
jgi:hypothetical protein